MRNIIVDTSVVVKWFSAEQDSTKANALLDANKNDEIEFLFPQTVLFELINSLFHSKKFSQTQTEQSVRLFLDLKAQFIPIDEFNFQQETISLVYQTNLTSYDASFIALANIYKTTLITADYKHHKKSISPYILWLSEWKA